jgi:hypothetical protein
MALGNVDIKTLERVDNFSPDDKNSVSTDLHGGSLVETSENESTGTVEYIL